MQVQQNARMELQTTAHSSVQEISLVIRLPISVVVGMSSELEMDLMECVKVSVPAC